MDILKESGIAKLLNSKKFTAAMIALIVEVLFLSGVEGGLAEHIVTVVNSVWALAALLVSTYGAQDYAEAKNTTDSKE